jgi:hypothetical protein
MPLSSCAVCGAQTSARDTACPHGDAHARPKHATAISVLCNCASVVIAVALALPCFIGATDASEPAAALKEQAPRPAFCGDKGDCLAGSEVAQAITRWSAG